MNPDYKPYADYLGQGAFSATGEIMKCVGIGLLVIVILLIVYSKLGVFRREGKVWYNRLAKLWIVYIIVVVGYFSFAIGAHRALYKAMSDAQKIVVDVIYERYMMGPLMTTETRDQVVTLVQHSIQAGQTLESAAMAAIKQVADKVITKDSGALGWVAQKGVHLVIDHYENEILASILFLVATKAKGKLSLHSGSPQYSYEDFKAGLEYLKEADPQEVEQSVKSKLAFFTSDKLDIMKYAGTKVQVIIASILLLLPLVDWMIFKKVVKAKMVGNDPMK